ncbi:hypothetical protein [Staphylococcus epidermidis]|uniref:hypothetical protein n=1 Tax=Staphylococcus epidermidis TaxID=1282 RepID=UPI00035539E4|nr:hypothetical protein [Staphylococcus epidermidis]EPP69654.1 hypothetical protein M458_09260 [Staphylococcus epidermidis Scl22]ESR05412.1 hypothetical protein M462_0206735 [Staphylococcus epidermidis CIM28]ESR22014.1 hypothetical protein M452_0210485 [Staphylococcus epidermidis APO35]ESU03437.1 hypothetical protein M461_0208685 [Staphylococcus epidermidis CIM37]ESV11043.1 hypothetical protein M456_0200925 [Staphylococcus epidermidis MC28]
MLTKEFAQRVELSEKQVRKIVQHLEERGYHLSKTEYRGREATDFKEDDIELFTDIANKVKQTNSYDLAFEELEKEKDFLQVIVKDEDSQLPTDQNVAQLVEDLRSEIQKMREERQMLGQMINQVHHQQQELKELQTDITTKLESNAQSLKSIQNSQEAIQSAQEQQSKDIAKANELKDSELRSHFDSMSNSASISQSTTASLSQSESVNDSMSSSLSESNSITSESNTNSKSEIKSKSTSTSEFLSESGSVSNSEKSESISHSQSTSATPSSQSTYQQQPKEEKKGFFARLFNL